MKKVIVSLLAVLMCLAVFAGCGSSGTQGDPEVSGETFDGGNVSALVPDGWMAFHGTDVFGDYEEGYDPNVIQICKGAKSELDMFSKPYMQINYYGADTTMMTPGKEWYDDTADLEPMNLGNYTWNGFTGVSMEYPIAILWTEDGDAQFQISIWLEMEDGKISLDDADVQAIIASIQPVA